MNTNQAPKVDPSIAFTDIGYIPATTLTLDAALAITERALEKARHANRQPIMVEVIVRVAL